MKPSYFVLPFAVALAAGCAESEGAAEDTEVETVVSESDTEANVGDPSPTDAPTADPNSAYTTELQKVAELDRAFSERIQYWTPERYLVPESVTQPQLRAEFREMVAQYRKDIDEYEASMNEFYDGVVRVAEENGEDAEAVEAMADELRLALATTIQSYHDTADSYLAVLDVVEQIQPQYNPADGNLVFENDSQIEQFNVVVEQLMRNEDRMDQALGNFEALRQQALQN
jgi:CRISPR/Cas system CSM-associated protein Csm2 small subunit